MMGVPAYPVTLEKRVDQILHKITFGAACRCDIIGANDTVDGVESSPLLVFIVVTVHVFIHVFMRVPISESVQVVVCSHVAFSCSSNLCGMKSDCF